MTYISPENLNILNEESFTKKNASLINFLYCTYKSIWFNITCLDGWCDIKPAHQERSVDDTFIFNFLYVFNIFPSFYSRLLLIPASPQILTAWGSQQTQLWSISSRLIKTTILFLTAASDRVRLMANHTLSCFQSINHYCDFSLSSGAR